ncbi:MAG: hypothetical protein E7660_00825 [Ruminococcaceae bacterium]|nr:hypothetical protein [Oscillospiraceae bacterium]
MNSGTHYAEYATSQKAEGKFATRKLGFIIGYVVVIAAMLGGSYAIFQEMFAVFGFIFLVLGIALVFFTKRFILPDYKYVIESGDMKFYINYGKRDKLLFTAKIKDMEAIAPYEGEYLDAANASDIAATYDYRGTAKTPDGYYAIFNKDGKKCVVIFENCENAMKQLYYYNKAAVKREKFNH